MKNFCALPFHHLDVRTNGDYNVCCHHRLPKKHVLNINHSSYNSWFESEYLQEVRNSIVKDLRHPGCQQCWQREDSGFSSMRQRTAKEYRILGINTNEPSIKNVEIDLGNLCNLKCLMCNETNSSSILAENQRLNISQHKQSDFKWTDDAFQNLQQILDQNPRVVNIRGGEPFYNNKLLEIVQNISNDRSKSMVLHITTNATVWNQEWKQALSKFRLVRIMISLDAVGDLYEYIRYPASWERVQQNVSEMSLMPNFKLLVHCVGQNLNIAHIGDLIDWCQQKKLYLEIESISYPHYMSIENLPDSHKKQVIDNLTKLLNHREYPKHICNFITSSIDSLCSSVFDAEKWREFSSNISMRDRLRKNDYRDFIKE